MTSLAFNEEDAHLFYTFIDHRSGEFTELRVFDPVLIDAPPKERVWVSTEAEFIALCRKWCNGYHIYAGVNPRKNRFGGSIEDIARIACIPWDIDSDHPKNEPATENEKKQAQHLLYAFLKWNKKLGFNNPYIDDSGNGFHIINKVDIKFEDYKQIDRKLKNFFKEAKAVFPSLDNISDLPRIIRVPGTWNIKGTHTKERPHRQAIILQTGTKGNDQKLEEYIQNLIFPTIPDRKQIKREIKTTEKLDPDKIKLLKRCQQRFLADGGRLSPKGDRNAETGLRMNLVRSMHRTGFTKEEILKACEKFDDYKPAKSTMEVNRILEEIESNTKTATEWYCESIVRNDGCIGPECQDYKSNVKYPHIDPLNFFILTNKGGPKKFVPRRMADAIMKIHRFLATSEKSDIWIYNENKGVWKNNGSEIIQNTATEWLKQLYHPSYVTSALTNIRHRNYAEIDILGGPPEKVVMENGVYDLLAGEFSEFDPGLYAIVSIPVTYDPEAKCPKILKFLDEISHPIDKPKLIEYPGYCLFKSFPIARIIVLEGEGHNGKSTYLRLVTAFLGKKNVSSVTLQKIAEGGFRSAELFGKLANICGDIPAKPIKETGPIKMLTGSDPITAERKFKDPFQYYNHAKPAFSANELPPTYDQTIAYHRRMIRIPFDNHFPSDGPKTDINILEKITTPSELSGFFNLAVEGLRTFLKQKKFSGEKSVAERKMDYIKHSDPVHYFALKFIEISIDSWITKAQLYDHYVHLCQKLRKIPIANTWFSRNVRRFMPYVHEGIERINNVKTHVWRGIRVKIDLLQKEPVKRGALGQVGQVGQAFSLLKPYKNSGQQEIGKEDKLDKFLLDKNRENTRPTCPKNTGKDSGQVLEDRPTLQDRIEEVLEVLRVGEGMTLAEVAARFDMEEDESKKILGVLEQDGLAFCHLDFWRVV